MIAMFHVINALFLHDHVSTVVLIMNLQAMIQLVFSVFLDNLALLEILLVLLVMPAVVDAMVLLLPASIVLSAINHSILHALLVLQVIIVREVILHA